VLLCWQETATRLLPKNIHNITSGLGGKKPAHQPVSILRCLLISYTNLQAIYLNQLGECTLKALRFVTPFLILASLFVGLFAQSPQTSFASVQAAAAAASPVGGPSGTNWAQTFGDEFDGASVNRSAWRSDYFPNGGNGEMQQYVTDNSHNSYMVSNGILQIVGRKESLNGQPYTSGIIHTKGLFEQKYGYFEMRAKVPAGKGYWPAFWLLPDQDNWVPEVDVMEILCDKPNVDYMTYHYNNSSGSYTQTQSTYSGTNFSIGWHTFAVDWEPNAMVWYVDGVEQKRVTDSSIIPSMPMYLIANLAIGGNWPGSPDSSTVFPSTLDIDYIRAWQKSAGTPPAATPTKPVVTSTPTKPAVTATPTKTATSLPPVSGANLLSNPSFETWNAPWGFRNDLGATFSQDTSTAANGSHASFKASLPTNSSSQPWVVSVNQSNLALNSGQSYTLSFWAKASASRPIRAVVQGQNSPYTAYTTQTANLSTAWARYTFTFTQPTGTTTAMLNFNLADATGSVWIDEVTLARAGQAGTATQVFIPTITKTSVSTNTLMPSSAPTKAPTATALPAANMISNASFETWNAPWGFRNDLGATLSQDTSTAANGSHASFKASLPKSSSSQPWVVSLNQSNKSLSAGQSYTLSFWAKASAARPIRAIIQGQNSPYTEYTKQTANLTSAWVRYTFTFTAPTNTTTAMLNFNLADATGSVWIDEVNLCRTGLICK
jgi:beta-glucanase (GH16 family)